VKYQLRGGVGIYGAAVDEGNGAERGADVAEAADSIVDVRQR
jgi:hypothetical protein